MIEFTPFPKVARLNRNIIITEKIDGTNAAVGVTEEGQVYAQSRTRLITPDQDNFGFARWVQENASMLREVLGVGVHFGEWWGAGIQRGYGLKEKRFSLFNSHRWTEALSPSSGDNIIEYVGALGVVPVLYEGPFDQGAIEDSIAALRDEGSRAAPGFMDPEGVVVYLAAARTMFKVTVKNDEKPKGSQEEA